MSAEAQGASRIEGGDIDAFPLGLLRTLLECPDSSSGMTEFLFRLARDFDCDRVSVGFVYVQAVRLAGISHSFAQPEEHMLEPIVAAMEESLLQDAPLAFPCQLESFPRIVLAQQRLAEAHHLRAVLTVPFGAQGRLFGALCFESTRRHAFEPHELARIQQLASDAGPLLRFKWLLQQPWWRRMRHRIHDALAEGGVARWRLFAGGALAAVLALLGLFAVPVSGAVSGQARLEASVQRLLSAPVDGYLKEVRVLPGDRVSARQVLAELEDDRLRTELRRLQAESAQLENHVIESMVKGDRTQLAQKSARLEEVRAEMALVTQQLERIRLVAPFDGVVIKGDLMHLLGAPLKRGDVLLTLSQGTGFRVMIEVPERDIEDIALGQEGVLVLAALPARRFPVRIARIMPVATVSEDGRNVFEVEAALNELAAELVPGMKGVVKIAAREEPLGWRWARRFWHALHFLAWSWL